MKRIAVEFVPPRERPGLWWLGSAVLCVLSVALAVDAHHRYVATQEYLEQRALRQAHAERARQRMQTEQEKQAQAERQLDALAAPWLDVVSFDWDGVLLSVERLKLPGLRVTTMSIDAKQGVARLTIDCLEAQSALEAVAMLNAGLEPEAQPWHLERLSLKQASAQGSGGVEAEISYRRKPPVKP